MSSAVRPLTRNLVSPSRISHALEWNKALGSILTMTIGKDSIGLTVSSHPSMSHYRPQSLPTIPLQTKNIQGKRIVPYTIGEEIARTANLWHACGIIVHWPTTDTGRAGYAAGRTLFVLEQLQLDEQPLPICLWSERDNGGDEQDEWGRSSTYARRPSKSRNDVVSSRERLYETTDALDSQQVWNDFCRLFWPACSTSSQMAWLDDDLLSEEESSRTFCSV